MGQWRPPTQHPRRLSSLLWEAPLPRTCFPAVSTLTRSPTGWLVNPRASSRALSQLSNLPPAGPSLKRRTQLSFCSWKAAEERRLALWLQKSLLSGPYTVREHRQKEAGGRRNRSREAWGLLPAVPPPAGCINLGQSSPPSLPPCDRE